MSLSDGTGFQNKSSLTRAHVTDKLLQQVDFSKYNLRDAVKLPRLETSNEWIAYNLFDFHKLCFMLFETVSIYCTPESCPAMTAGPKFKFLWADTHKITTQPCARDYIYCVLDWVQEQLDNDSIFPSVSTRDATHPENFTEICQTIARRILRVYAHIYHDHLPKVKELKEEAHMNTSLKHFIYFLQEFDLVPSKEYDPLQEFIDSLT